MSKDKKIKEGHNKIDAKRCTVRLEGFEIGSYEREERSRIVGCLFDMSQ